MSPRNAIDDNPHAGDPVVLPHVWIELIVNAILLCGAIMWATFGIIFLVNDRRKCGGYNQFWVYCCACIFATVFGYFISLRIYVKDETAFDGIGRLNIITLIAYFCFEAPFIVWGAYAIYVKENVCHNEMYDESGEMLWGKLYIWAQVTYWIRIAYFLLNGVGVAVVLNRPEKKQRPLVSNSAQQDQFDIDIRASDVDNAA